MPEKQVIRHEDMSFDGRLILLQQRDGDMIVNIRPSKSDRDYEGSPFGVTVEFCVSGGRSRNTLQALRELMSAMEKDNAEKPIDEQSPAESMAIRDNAKTLAAEIASASSAYKSNSIDELQFRMQAINSLCTKVINGDCDE